MQYFWIYINVYEFTFTVGSEIIYTLDKDEQNLYNKSYKCWAVLFAQINWEMIWFYIKTAERIAERDFV
jgi:hypothetical protein